MKKQGLEPSWRFRLLINRVFGQVFLVASSFFYGILSCSTRKPNTNKGGGPFSSQVLYRFLQLCTFLQASQGFIQDFIQVGFDCCCKFFAGLMHVWLPGTVWWRSVCFFARGEDGAWSELPQFFLSVIGFPIFSMFFELPGPSGSFPRPERHHCAKLNPRMGSVDRQGAEL